MDLLALSAEILRWWLISVLFGVIGLRPAQIILSGLPAAVPALARPLGLLLVGTISWWLAMLGLGGFSGWLLTAVVSVSLLISLATVLRSSCDIGRQQRTDLISGEAVFVLALTLTALLRSYEPTPWGTERAMDFAFFNAIQQSAQFPPHDPWLSGYSINYYYFGYLLMSVPALLSGLPATTAYNLSLALIAALTAQGLFGLVTALLRSLSHRAPAWAERGLALTAVLSVLLLGNQAGTIQVLLGDERATVLNGGELLRAFGQVLRGDDAIVLEPPVQAHDFGLLAGWPRRDRTEDFNWWQPSRALWDDYGRGGASDRRPTITEFAFFSLRLGDMHPHVMALPFGLLALATGLATAIQPIQPRWLTWRRGGQALVLGVLYPLNSWDVPAYALLYGAALALAYGRAARAADFDWRGYLRELAQTALPALLFYLPFYLTVRALVGAREPLLDWPIIGRLSSTLGLYPAERTGWHSLVILYGPLLIAVTALFVRSAWRVAAARSWLWIALALLPFALWLGWPSVVLFALALAAAAALLAQPQRVPVLVLLPALLGTAIVFGVDVVYIRDVFEGFSARMNTIFKFSYQVLLIWAVATPPALWWLLQTQRRAWRIAAGVVTGLVLLLMLSGLTYPLLSLRQLRHGTPIGLTAPTPRERTPAGAASIRWLRDNTPRGSIVLEAPAVENSEDVILQGAQPVCGGSYNYDGFGGVAAASGRATLLGWVGHQRQWRGGDTAALDELQPRCAAADAVYRSGDVTRVQQLAEQYTIDYIYVGELERRIYRAEQLAALALAGRVVYEQDEVVIYALE